MSKLISEADKLLEKGKIPEALEKLKAALKGEPLNQLVAAKLANVYVHVGEVDKAVKVYVALASRLSEAGKAQVAIAIYKQALELDPNDIELKIKFAIECEAVGKMGDANLQAQQALSYFLHRKKYFDAANLLPLLVRIQPKDEKLKATWIEVLEFSQAEQKLVHLLVALCGPPGIMSEEFSVGGEPAALSEGLYDSLKKLTPYFPRDPKIAYAIAWAAHRRGKTKDFYQYLHECLRRDPDFCLGILLWARILAEQQKQTEAYFLFKHLKERMTADRSVDMPTLNRLVDGFTEKNPWVVSPEIAGIEEIDAATFRNMVTGQVAAPAPVAKEEILAEESSAPRGEVAAASPTVSASTPKPAASINDEAAPAEIEISLGSDEDEGGGELEVQFAGDQTRVISAKAVNSAIAKPQAQTPAPAAVELFVAPVSLPPLAPVEEVAVAAPVLVEAAEIPIDSLPEPALAEAMAPLPVPEEPAATPIEAARVTFNPLENITPPALADFDGEKTEMFSPMDLLDAGDRALAKSAEAETRTTLKHQSDLASRAESKPPPEEAAEVAVSERVEGEATEMFSPFEAVEAGVASRRPFASAEPAPAIIETVLSLEEQGEATQMLVRPDLLGDEPAAPEPVEEPVVQAPTEAKRLNIFTPIPELKPPAAPEPVAADGIDMGDDLLQDPTQMFNPRSPLEATNHLVNEMKRDLREAKQDTPEALLKKSERYIAKRNYYMARKILRHALALGGDEVKIKDRLREIRKVEMPDSFYNAMSSDETSKESSGDILDRLEEEFELQIDAAVEGAEFSAGIEAQLESVFRETEPRTILDFGIALHEMGLFRQAEMVFARLVDEFPEISFDAYYLAAVSKSARKDYAGAASILKKLSLDGGKTDLEKIQVFYALGEIFEKMRRTESSKEFYKKVAGLDANYRNIRHKLEE